MTIIKNPKNPVPTINDATARPWRIVTDTCLEDYVGDKQGKRVAWLDFQGMTPIERKANALLIVKAVNEYDALYEVVEMATILLRKQSANKSTNEMENLEFALKRLRLNQSTPNL